MVKESDLKMGGVYKFIAKKGKPERVALVGIKCNVVNKRKYYLFSRVTTMNRNGEHLLSPNDLSLWLYPDDMTTAEVLTEHRKLNVTVE